MRQPGAAPAEEKKRTCHYDLSCRVHSMRKPGGALRLVVIGAITTACPAYHENVVGVPET